MNQTVYMGMELGKELTQILEDYASKHIFLVRGKGSYKACGANIIIEQVLRQCQCQSTEFFDFQDNPKQEDLEKGLNLMQKTSIDTIVAVGGGSIIDMAKLIRFFHSYSGEITSSKFIKKSALLPLITIPTTAGTGAEATHFAVVYKDGIKYSVEHEDILPNNAVIFPPFTFRNSTYLTACTGFDALSQAIEAYWNRNATRESDMYAERAIKLLWTNLPFALNAPSDEIRTKLCEGAYWSGRAINITKTTAPHAFSYPFTSYYGYPHGHAVALVFPFIADLNLQSYSRREKIFSMIRYDGTTSIESYFSNYLAHLGLMLNPETEIDINLIVSNINLDRLRNNPVEIDKMMAEDIISRLCGRNPC